jgi:hypothetical protein
MALKYEEVNKFVRKNGGPLVPLAFLVDFHVPSWILPTVISIVASFWLGRRFRTKSQMAYQSHDATIIREPGVASLGEIKILFNEVPVPRVVVTQLAVWNAGDTVVNATDIVTDNPLKVCFDRGTNILDAQLVNATQESNKFKITVAEDKSCAFLEFAYLNAKDGAKFQIIHTGANGKAKVTGSLKGIPKGVEDWGGLQEWREGKSYLNQFTPLILTYATIFLMILLGKSLVSKYPFIAKLGDWLAYVFGGLALIGVAIGVFYVFVKFFKFFRAGSRSAPKSLSRN